MRPDSGARGDEAEGRAYRKLVAEETRKILSEREAREAVKASEAATRSAKLREQAARARAAKEAERERRAARQAARASASPAPASVEAGSEFRLRIRGKWRGELALDAATTTQGLHVAVAERAGVEWRRAKLLHRGRCDRVRQPRGGARSHPRCCAGS